MLTLRLVWISITVVLVLAIEKRHAERKLHRLVGGHLRLGPNSEDAELLWASASATNAKNSKNSQKKHTDDEEKTLSQQVADGKYGLIQKELFPKTPKKPGVLSYESNAEVPKDNVNNLGGLKKDDIWLAENHLLVLRGGSYPTYVEGDTAVPVWPPIDDFKAPARPVKIPANPEVPPPFPVQLTDDGPLQILGTNSSRTLNGTTFDEGTAIFALPPPEGYIPGTGPYFKTKTKTNDTNPTNAAPGRAAQPIPKHPPGEYQAGGPFPPFPLNGTLAPFFASLPPGAVAVPPPPIGLPPNEAIDEDDPSIYYPPPYSFFYPVDNSTMVRAGPLVPGIILPPPPNFFAPLEKVPKPKSTTTTTRRPPIAFNTVFRTPKPSKLHITTTTEQRQIRPTTTPISATSAHDNKNALGKTPKIPIHIPSEINNELKPTVRAKTTTTNSTPKLITILPSGPYSAKIKTPIPRIKKPQKVTVLRPVNTTPKGYGYGNDVKPFEIYGPPPSLRPNVLLPSRPKTMVTSTQAPLKLYYSTSANEIDDSIQHLPEKFRTGPNFQKNTQYFFYDDEKKNTVSTPKTRQTNYYDVPSRYFVPPNEQPIQHFVYVTGKPFTTVKPRYTTFARQPKTDTFSLHIAKLQKQIQQFWTTTRAPAHLRQYNSPRPIYQYSFEAANYRPPQQQKQFRPSPAEDDNTDKFMPIPNYSVQIQPAVQIYPTQQPPAQPVFFQEKFPITTTERPYMSSSTNRPIDYDYNEESNQSNRPAISSTTPPSQVSFKATPNPLYQQGYYTKPDEVYFDDITKKYFTNFGQKLQQTTPAPPRQKPNAFKIHTESIASYLQSRPQSADTSPKYSQVAKFPSPPPSPPPPPNKQTQRQPEIIRAIPIEVPSDDGPQGSFISYQLPGDDGAHFYFLTPQLAQRREQGARFFYSQGVQTR